MAEIKVTITDETGGSSSTSVTSPRDQVPTPTDVVNKAGSPKTKEATNNKNNSKALALAAMIGSRCFNYTTSNVGKYTGNSKNQQVVNNALQIGSITAAAYANPYAAMISVALNIGQTAIDNAYDMKWSTASSENRMAKAGYNNVGEIVGRRH